MKQKILIVDDDFDIVKSLESRLQWLGYQIFTAQDGLPALGIINKEKPALVLLDLELPTLSGLELLKRLPQLSHMPIVIIMTAFGSIERAVEAMKLGALDFIIKPFDQGYLKVQIKKALDQDALRHKGQCVQSQIDERYAAIVGESQEMQTVLKTARQAANTDVSVLLMGETGTGKELLARSIHRWSPRGHKPFMVINCAALPESLLENELFGHERGAYTGATERQAGKLEAADGGTVFLDEIGDMPITFQCRLLRLLQDKEFHRIGGTQSLQVDVRFIAATNKNLSQGIGDGTFRQDLFFRLNVFPITLPPLRARMTDLAELAASVLNRERNRTTNGVKRLGENTLNLMKQYHWPGNIRELENVLIRASILSQGQEIDPTALCLEKTTPSLAKLPTQISTNESYHEHMETFSKEVIIDALRKTDWNQTKAAAYLKLQRTYFTKLLKQKHIPTKPPQA
ncbi:MAG: sigma-54 dependent transcriptional regulator [Nitrospirota bacterium]|nr:sigma-54 dependent transcriptional regulator [Nitrospirota bacterium]